MLILHLLSKYRFLNTILYVALWPLMWFVAPLFLRVRVALEDGAGNVLLVKHSFGPDVWMLPGGGVKFGETPHKSLIREVQEELALDISNHEVSALHEKPKIWTIHGLHYRVLLYKTTLDIDSFKKIQTSHEIRDLAWFSASSQEVSRALPRDLSL